MILRWGDGFAIPARILGLPLIFRCANMNRPRPDRHVVFQLLSCLALMLGWCLGLGTGVGEVWGQNGGLGLNAFPLPGGGPISPTPPLEIPPPPLTSDTPLKFSAPTPEVTPALPEVSWYNPWTWIPWDGWTNSAELGINGTDGNSKSFSLQTGAKFTRKNDRDLFEMRISHNRTQANGIETQNNALFFQDFDRKIASSNWTWFEKFGMEYDQFKAFDLRLNLNTGIGYRWIDDKKLRFTTRFGAGTSREIGGPDDRWVAEAVFGGDYDHQVTDRHKLYSKVDYYPEWSNFSNFRAVIDAGWEYLLDEKGNLSLKLGANDRYDSTPNGRKPNDINYSFLVLYKF